MTRVPIVVLKMVLLLSIVVLRNETQAADQYPDKPITFIVPIEAGSDGDILTRPLVQKAAAGLGRSMVVVNKPGGGSTIGYMELLRSKPDGYTIGMSTITIITNKLQGLAAFDYHDFTVLGTFYACPNNVFGSKKSKRPFKTIQEAIAFAKANPGELSVATGGIGQSIWIGAQAFISGTGINANVIPQAGAGALVVTQIAGGHADLGVLSLPAAKPQIDAGNISFLASLGSKRPPAPYSDVPTMLELGYEAVWESFGIVMGPPNLPPAISEKLAKAFAVAANDPEYHKFISGLFCSPFYLPPDKIVPYSDERRKSVRGIMAKANILKEK